MKYSYTKLLITPIVSLLFITGCVGDQEDSATTSTAPSTNIGGFIVSTDDRQEVVDYYNDEYLSSLNVPIEWTGDHTTCTEGTTSANFKSSVLKRINYFRAMAGVPSNVLLDSTFSQKAQKAAFMMSVNSQLGHYPPNTWDCYSTEGAEGAKNSNLSGGSNGWEAVDGQIQDNGANNTLVGHRNWLLLPQLQSVGIGDIPATSGYFAANAIWVFDGHYFDSAIPEARDGFIAWPTKGYNPYQVVPVRWSLSHPDADFTNASVVVSYEGASVPVIIDSNDSSEGIGTIVWRLNNMSANGIASWPEPTEDMSYSVQVSNVVVNGNATEFNYTVTVVNP